MCYLIEILPVYLHISDQQFTFQVQALKNDTLFMKCGDAVEWADFRTGTRGAMKMKWPSLIMGKTLLISL